MAKAKTAYACTECGGTTSKWQGQCPNCGVWNTLVETIAVTPASRFQALAGGASVVRALSSVDASDNPRLPTGIEEFDRVLGGGLVPGGVILLGGDPGIGKSTLLLQAMASIGISRRALYVTGEESADQIGAIVGAIRPQAPDVVVIDSIQTVYTEALESAPGSVAQVRECAAQLTRLAKQTGITILLVGHVTKEGAIAGPRVLEHIVDTVLYFEGDTHSSFRLVRAIKNRFGAANELGVFAMTERGLKGVANPSALFLSQHGKAVPGSCVLATLEGSRPLLVEVQALVDPVQGALARRVAVGLDPQRLALLLAVLHRHGGVETAGQDVFVNAVGGVRIGEPAADLAISMAVYSSFKNIALDSKSLVFGEVGLAGEIRPVQRGQERLRDAAKLGFRRAIIPAANKPKQRIEGMDIVAVERIDEALDHLRG